MRERRALRFVVEALFLGALAAALAFSELEALEIAGVMTAGWLVVALFEWATTRELPHFGRGLPPRYYVPQVALPPPRQLEQLRSGYPASGLDGDEATWIATPEMRAEALADWPVDVIVPAAPGEDTMVVAIDELALEGAVGEPFHEDTWIELDPVAEGRPEPEAEADAEPELATEPAAVEELDAVEAPVVEAVLSEEVEVVAEPVADEPPALDAAEAAGAVAAERETQVAQPEAEEAIAEEPDPVEEAEPVVVPEAAAVVVDEAPFDEPELLPGPEPEAAEVLPPRDEPELDQALAALAEAEPPATGVAEREAEPAVVAAAVAVALPAVGPLEDDTEEDVVRAAPPPPAPVRERPARHTFDPLPSETPHRRRWRRRGDDPYVELPAGPPRPKALPGAARHEQ